MYLDKFIDECIYKSMRGLVVSNTIYQDLYKLYQVIQRIKTTTVNISSLTSKRTNIFNINSNRLYYISLETTRNHRCIDIDLSK